MLALTLLILAVAIWAILMAQSKEDEETTRVEVEEYRDWHWPSRKVGPVGRSHLGRRGQ
jgi:hypothetical protein